MTGEAGLEEGGLREWKRSAEGKVQDDVKEAYPPLHPIPGNSIERDGTRAHSTQSRP